MIRAPLPNRRLNPFLVTLALGVIGAVTLLTTPQAGSAARGGGRSLAPGAPAVISGAGAWHVLDSSTPAAERPEILAGARSLWCGRYDPCWVDSVGYPDNAYEILYIDSGTHTADYKLTMRMNVSTELFYDYLYLIGGGAGSVDPIGDNDVLLTEIIETGVGTFERLLVTWTGSIESNTPGAKRIDTTGGPVLVDGSNDQPSAVSTEIDIASVHRALYLVFQSDELFSSADGGWPLGTGAVLDTLATSDNGSIYSDTPAVGSTDAFGGVVIVGTAGAPVVSSRRGPKPFGRSPSITPPAGHTAFEGGPVSLTATASDPDGGDTVSITAFDYPSGLAFAATSGNPASANLNGAPGAGTAAGSPYHIRWCANSVGGGSADNIGAVSMLVVTAPTAVPDGPSAAPRALILGQNRPNPFNGRTLFRYQIPREGPVFLRIYDTHGRRVATLVERRMPPGTYDAAWDGRDDRGRDAPSGVYTCRLEAGETAVSRWVALIR